jgi:hypothetical protein
LHPSRTADDAVNAVIESDAVKNLAVSMVFLRDKKSYRANRRALRGVGHGEWHLSPE